MLKAHTIRNDHADTVTLLHGDLEACATECRSPPDAGRESLVFVTTPEQLAEATQRNAAILIVQEKIAALARSSAAGARCCFSARSIPMAMAMLLKHFDRKAQRFTQWGTHHATAVVHADASVGQNVVLGPYCVIGARAVIGDGCLIGAHTVVENDARIGADTILHPQVFIGAGCEVGRSCEIHPHTTVGCDGFGYAKDRTGRPRKISQLGKVCIGDAVEIGGNCAIDRATLTATHIRSGAKLDNICHIAHNCDLGENGLYTAGFMMAGSTTIGRNFVTGGNSVVSAHLTLADDVILAGRSTVTNDITESGQYGGYPLQPIREALKTLVSLGQLNSMRKKLNDLFRHERAANDAPRTTRPNGN
jgi:UDP-3-O-[3-hydroxymyristoyl] glucosamine N-acyltransferase